MDSEEWFLVFCGAIVAIIFGFGALNEYLDTPEKICARRPIATEFCSKLNVVKP